MKTCTVCKTEKSLDDFYNRKTASDGKRCDCKECSKKSATKWNRENPEKFNENKIKFYKTTDNYKNRSRFSDNHPPEGWTQEDVKRYRLAEDARRSSKYRSNVKGATPAWSDEEEISKVFLIAQERDLAVDHIVPLDSKEVCGLNTPDNLRCIPHLLNQIKNNNYWPDMWNDSEAHRLLSKHIA